MVLICADEHGNVIIRSSYLELIIDLGGIVGAAEREAAAASKASFL